VLILPDDRRIFVGDTGTLISVDTLSDLTGATTALIKYIKPSGSRGSWGGTLNGTRIEYRTQTGDLDEIGDYKIYVYVELPDWSGHGEVDIMTVSEEGT